MTVPRGTRPPRAPDNRVIPLYPYPWEGQDPLGVSSIEKIAMRDRERAARYAGFDRMALDDGPMVEQARRRRHRYGRGALIGVLAGALLAGAAWYGAHGAEGISGIATVTDGDTIRIGQTRIRLWGIDAPESQQTCGNSACGIAATNAMRAMLTRDPHVVCQARDTDRYGRTVAVCRNGEGELNARMVALGWAVDYTRYSHGAYRDHQDAARAERLGIWAATFQNPETWRRESRTR